MRGSWFRSSAAALPRAVALRSRARCFCLPSAKAARLWSSSRPGHAWELAPNRLNARTCMRDPFTRKCSVSRVVLSVAEAQANSLAPDHAPTASNQSQATACRRLPRAAWTCAGAALGWNAWSCRDDRQPRRAGSPHQAVCFLALLRCFSNAVHLRSTVLASQHALKPYLQVFHQPFSGDGCKAVQHQAVELKHPVKLVQRHSSDLWQPPRSVACVCAQPCLR